MDFPFEIDRRREFDVVGFGTNAVDYLVRVPAFPEFNSKVEFTDFTRQAGGEVATTLVGLQRLGIRTSYVGRFGDDDAGRFGHASLIEEGVDVSRSEFIVGAQTQHAFILIDEQSGERTIIWKRDKALRFVPDGTPIDV